MQLFLTWLWDLHSYLLSVIPSQQIAGSSIRIGQTYHTCKCTTRLDLPCEGHCIIFSVQHGYVRALTGLPDDAKLGPSCFGQCPRDTDSFAVDRCHIHCPYCGALTTEHCTTVFLPHTIRRVSRRPFQQYQIRDFHPCKAAVTAY